MADNITIPASGTGTATPVIATDDVASVHYQIIKTTIGPLDSAGSLIVGGAGAVAAGVQRVTLASDDPAVAALTVLDDWDSTDAAKTVGFLVTCATQVTRPANTTTYAINDALADTTPTTGGFTFTNAARASGGSGIITDIVIVFDEDAATPLQGEVFIFDQAVTAIADNAAFAISDAEARTCVGKVPFILEDIGNNGFYHAQALNIGFTCSGTANLRFLVRAKNAYVPTTNSSVITFIAKIMQIT